MAPLAGRPAAPASAALALVNGQQPVELPAHRWAANEDADVRAHSPRDRCLTCGAFRWTPPGLPRADERNQLAAGPCPGKAGG